MDQAADPSLLDEKGAVLGILHMPRAGAGIELLQSSPSSIPYYAAALLHLLTGRPGGFGTETAAPSLKAEIRCSKGFTPSAFAFACSLFSIWKSLVFGLAFPSSGDAVGEGCGFVCSSTAGAVSLV
mmetsp:Transcript_2960/g.4815  ORF Transcript_2960/g.4815 Transcript_2960/m.4815 type:complete len:126 (-) Transcript_2960:243-620(-)